MSLNARSLVKLLAASALVLGCSSPEPMTPGIILSPAQATVPVGLKAQFAIVPTINMMAVDGGDVSGATWTSSDPNVATVDAGGAATGVKAGTTTITATLNSLTATATLTVTDAVLESIAITPAMPTLVAGLSSQLVATGTFSDGSTMDISSAVTWASADVKTATVSSDPGMKGVVTGVAMGMTTITATEGVTMGQVVVTVSAATLKSIAITPANPTLAAGTTMLLIATATLSDSTTMDVTTSAAWSSGDETIATVGTGMMSPGLLQALKAGGTMVTATVMNVSGSTPVLVTPAVLQAIAVTPVNPQVPLGTTLQLHATGTFSDNTTQDLTNSVAWSTSDNTVATVDNMKQKGVVAGIKAGASTIGASQGGVMGTTVASVTPAVLQSISITPNNPSIAKGTTQQFTATGLFSDRTTQDLTSSVTWASSDPSASISNANGTKGLATGASVGMSTITATQNGVTGMAVLTVSAAALDSITVTPGAPSIAKGTTVQFTATGTYSDQSTQDLTQQVTWSTVDNNVATVSNAMNSQGLATGAGTGMTTVKATLGNVTGSAGITVSAANLLSLAITPVDPSVALGSTVQFTASGTFSDNSVQNLTAAATWTSSDQTVATVSNQMGQAGLATTLKAGPTTIGATVNGVSASSTLTVTAAVLTGITVTPLNPSIAKGTYLQCTAIGTYSDNTTQDVTTQVTWQSSSASVVVSNAMNSKGVVYGASAGSANVTASLQNVTGKTLVTVTAATLTSIAVTPANRTVAAGTQLQYTATGTFSDQSTQDLTAQVTWGSTNKNVASISNANGSQGLATGLESGNTAITAALSGVTGQTGLTVSPAVLLSIAVTPANLMVQFNNQFQSRQYTATATFSDNSTQDVTQQASWSSTNQQVAFMSGRTQGLAYIVGRGLTNIVASLRGVTGKTSLTVQ